MLNSVPYDAVLKGLAQAHRVLVPDGILRISMPDLDVIRLLPDTSGPELQGYIRWSNRNFGSAAERADADNPAHVLNRMMQMFDLRYLLRRGHIATGIGSHRFPQYRSL
jgi:hypothetical protein